MSIAVNQSLPLLAIQGVSADVVLQAGSVIQAKVLSILSADQVRLSIGSQTIDVVSQVPLQAGQTLQLAVSQTADGIRLAVVNQQSSSTATEPATAGYAATSTTLDTVTLASQPVLNVAAQTAPSIVPLTNQLTAQEALAVSVAAQTAATQQTSLAPLFADLSVASQLKALPPKLQAAVAQLLAQRTTLDQTLTGNDIKQAFQQSGLFLEASLASGTASATAPDLKASLIVLRQVLATALGATTATQATPALTTAPAQQAVAASLPELSPATNVAASLETTTSLSLAPLLNAVVASPTTTTPAAAMQAVAEPVFDLTAASQLVAPVSTPVDTAARNAAVSAALSLLQEVVQPASPQVAGNPSQLQFNNSLMMSLLPAATGVRLQKTDDAEFAHTNGPPPPIAGALPTAQAVVPATLVAHAPVEATLHHLLTETDGALARQTLLQVASLPGQGDPSASRFDPNVQRWNFEIPFATPQGTAVAQFEISRDGQNDGKEAASSERVWRARFSLDIEPAGPVHAVVSLSGEKTSVRIWAERPATAAQLRDDAPRLSQALTRANLHPGDIVVRDGAPIPPAPAAAGHFLDRAL